MNDTQLAQQVADTMNKRHHWKQPCAESEGSEPGIHPNRVLFILASGDVDNHPITTEIRATIRQIREGKLPEPSQERDEPIGDLGPASGFNYIELAHSTSAPVGPVQERLQADFKLLALLYTCARESVEVAENMDVAKRAIFYGKGNSNTLTISREHLANAAEAIKNPAIIEFIHAAIGMVTEAGEFLAMVGRHVFGRELLDTVNLREEIGDLQWYTAKACRFLDTTLELEQVRNIQKLAKRFPAKFTDVDALNRDLEEERKILELDVPLGLMSGACEGDREPIPEPNAPAGRITGLDPAFGRDATVFTAGNITQPELVSPPVKIQTKDDLLERAWTIIANASQGNWEKEHPDWQEAAANWRDSYHESRNSA